jgi:hypothetical protein
MSNTFFKECLISGLKEEIHAQVLMYFPTTWIEASKRARESLQGGDFPNKKIIFYSSSPSHQPLSLISSSQYLQVKSCWNGGVPT